MISIFKEIKISYFPVLNLKIIIFIDFKHNTFQKYWICFVWLCFHNILYSVKTLFSIQFLSFLWKLIFILLFSGIEGKGTKMHRFKYLYSTMIWFLVIKFLRYVRFGYKSQNKISFFCILILEQITSFRNVTLNSEIVF